MLNKTVLVIFFVLLILYTLYDKFKEYDSDLELFSNVDDYYNDYYDDSNVFQDNIIQNNYSNMYNNLESSIANISGEVMDNVNENNMILNDISFKVDSGDTLAIVGQSGVGKSVLLKHINGLLLPDKGKILVDNSYINQLSFKKLQNIRKDMSMVFQFGALFDSMTVRENIGLALQKLSNCDKLEVDKKITKSLEEVNMQGTENKMPSELSGGMKKRVGIARAIALDPQYMLYDEPTTGLDPIMTDSINKLITKFHNKGNVTSIIVTHEMRTVKDVSNRVIMLYNGKIRFDGATNDFLESSDSVVKSFLNGDSSYKQKEGIL